MLPTAWGAQISKSNGPPSPKRSDFGAAFPPNLPLAGYGNQDLHRAFLETLPSGCPPESAGAARAVFSITLRRLGAGPADSHAAQLGFWDHGAEHFTTRLWAPYEPRGTTKTLNFDIASLPAVGGMVLRNSGSGLNLLRDGDFSFSLRDDASVLSARLHYHCAADERASAGVVIGVYGIDLPLRDSGGIPPPCPALGTVHPRSPLQTDALMKRLAQRADQLCWQRNSRQGYASVRFLSCVSNRQGGSLGLSAQAEIACAP